MGTGSSCASVSMMEENAAPTIRSGANLVVEVSVAKWETDSGLFMSSFPQTVRLEVGGWGEAD